MKDNQHLYVGSSLMVHNPLFSQIVTEYINGTFLLVNKIKMLGILLNIIHRQVHKNI